MPEFSYTAVDRQGVTRSGTLQGLTADAVVQSLHELGVVPVEVRVARSARPSWLQQSPLRRRGVSRTDVRLFIQQLGALLVAGVSLDRALAIVQPLSESPALRSIIDDLAQALRRGSSLSQAMMSHGDVFDETLIGMIAAGEAGGTLPSVVQQLGEWRQRADDARERVRSSLIYPSILLAVMLLTLVLVVTVVLPRFESLFAEARHALPWSTRAVLALGRGAIDFAPLWIGASVALLLIGWRAWQQPAIRERVDRRLLSLPVLGAVIGPLESSRALGTCATLIRSGLVVHQAMRLASRTTSNRALRTALDLIVSRLREGGSLGQLLARARLFPPVAVQLVQVGEETGRLDAMLSQAAQILERDAQHRLDRLLALLVPVTTVAMGVLIAALIGSVLVGILSVNDLAL